MKISGDFHTARWQWASVTENKTLKPFCLNVLVRGWTGHCAQIQEIWTSRIYIQMMIMMLIAIIMIIIGCCVWICSVGRLSHDLHILVLLSQSLSGPGAAHKQQNQFGEVVLLSQSQPQVKAHPKCLICDPSDCSCPHRNLSAALCSLRTQHIPINPAVAPGLHWWKWFTQQTLLCFTNKHCYIITFQ